MAETKSAVTNYVHRDLDPASTWYYRVSAVNRAGAGEPSEMATATTDPVRPDPPASLRAEAEGSSRINLYWAAPAYTGGAPVTGYQIQVSDDGGGSWEVLVADTRSEATVYEHSGIPPGSTRHYRVSAINSVGVSDPSPMAFAKTEATVPDAPAELRAVAIDHEQVGLSWAAPPFDGGADITGYRIQYSQDGGVTWEYADENTQSARTEHVHGGLEPATAYHYRVAAINGKGAGPATDPVNVRTNATVPDAPSDLVAAATTPRRITLNWKPPQYDGGAAVTGYRVEVSPDGDEWEVLDDTDGPGTEYVHDGLAPGDTRHYRVSATNEAGTGSPSNVASATTDDPVERAARVNNGDPAEVRVGGDGGDRRGRRSARAGGGERRGRPAQRREPHVCAHGRPRSRTERPERVHRLRRHRRLGECRVGVAGCGGRPGRPVRRRAVQRARGLRRAAPAQPAGGPGGHPVERRLRLDRRDGRARGGGHLRGPADQHHAICGMDTGGRASVWTAASYGRGNVEIDDDLAGTRESAATLWTGAAGVTGRLLDNGSGALNVQAEGWSSWMDLAEADGIDAMDFRVRRIRALLEWTQLNRFEAGHEVGLLVNGGVRYELNEGVDDINGMELGGGLRYASPARRLRMQGLGRLLVAMDSDYEEWGIGAVVHIDPGAEGGLAMRLSPSYGAAESGVEALWANGVAPGTPGAEPGRSKFAVHTEYRFGSGAAVAARRPVPYARAELFGPARGLWLGTRVRWLALEGTYGHNGPGLSAKGAWQW